MTARVRWSSEKDRQGYWTTTDGRWKAAPKGDAVTLTDTTRRASFEGLSGPSVQAAGTAWVRLDGWPAVNRMIAAHRLAEKR